MAQTCRVCAHPKTTEIENDIVQGVAHTTIGKKYDVNFQSVRYHSENHLPEKLVKAVQNKKANHAENILDGINDLLQRTKDILESAEEKGHNRLALDAIKEARGTYELLSKIAVKLEEYRRRDSKQKESYAEQQVEEGLQALTTAELKTYIQLQGKIASANPDYELEPSARYMVDAMTTVKPLTRVDKPVATNNRDSDMPRNPLSQGKNSSNHGSTHVEDDEFEDWDDDLDLELDDLSLEEPDWLEEERQKSHKRSLGLKGVD